MKAAAALIVVALALTGCGRSAPTGQSSSQPTAAADDSGYRQPPNVSQAVRAQGGTVVLSGRALPDATVRLASPDGRGQETAADSSGGWSLAVKSDGPAIYSLSQEADGRRDHAQGYVAVLPHGAPAAVLRSGAGAVSLAGAPGRPQILAVDFDGSGATVVSGWAAPGKALRVLVDGVAVNEGAAGPSGRFFLALPKPLTPGTRTVRVAAPDGSADEVALDVSQAAPLAGVLHAAARGSAWRLDWMTPAGGGQSTVLFAPSGPKP
jgi:hypothetical protein